MVRLRHLYVLLWLCHPGKESLVCCWQSKGRGDRAVCLTGIRYRVDIDFMGRLLRVERDVIDGDESRSLEELDVAEEELEGGIASCCVVDG